MNRRHFLTTMSAGAGMLLLPGCSGRMDRFPRGKNILFLFADDQCHEALSLYGSEVHTPNLDRLAAGGVSFRNAYNQGAWHGAVCVASRTMFNTGRFLWHARALERTLGEEAENGRLWAQQLSSAGYRTYMSGKWHVKIDPAAIFDCTAHIRGGMPSQTEAGYNRPLDEEDYQRGWKPWERQYGGYWEGGKHWSEVLADDGTAFLKETGQQGSPFFMYLAFNAPHDPRQSPQSYVDEYPLERIALPDNYLPEYPYKDDIGCSARLRDERLAPFPRTPYAVKVNRQEYYAIISHMDAQIGRILDALAASGKKDDTYIFFTADHGLAIGHHGLMGKQNMFEHSMKPPLIVAGPGVPRGKTIDTPIYIQDIMPTTLELAGITPPDYIEFRSLLPLMAGRTSRQYDAVYGGYMDLQRMVRKDEWKLIHYPKIGKTLLFNLNDDPGEMIDRSRDPGAGIVLADLAAAMTRLQRQTGDTLSIDLAPPE